MGRAGRDGKPATALTLISETTGWLDPEDKQRRQLFIEQAQKQQRSAQALRHKLPLQGDITSVSRQFKDGAIALSLLNSTGQLEWTDPFHYVMQPGNTQHSGQSNTLAAKQMTQYLKTKDCRWRFLLGAFGFEAEATSFRCGHCDRCDR